MRKLVEIMNPWNNKQLRSMYDPTTQGYWFSVIDLYAILTDCDHKTARGYWKRLKYRGTNSQVVTVSHHLKFESPNSKYHFTEVVDLKNLINLVQTCPVPKPTYTGCGLQRCFLRGVAAAELEKEFAKLGAEAAEQIAGKYKDEGYARLTVKRKDLLKE